jgi:tetratricopeptide (TPR) repeat protein
MNSVNRPEYDGMYNKYLLQLYTEERKDIQMAIRLAEKEVAARPTPETFDWLAWAYYKNGENEKALTISRNFVHRKNFEPDALVHTAVIFAANGKRKEAINLFNECLESSFELGPLQTKAIHDHISNL